MSHLLIDILKSKALLCLPALAVDSCPCRAGGQQIAHLCLGNSISPCDCSDLGTCEVSTACTDVLINAYVLSYICNALLTYVHHHCPSLQCIDPYINDTISKQCSLDTDGDKIPDYRVSGIIATAYAKCHLALSSYSFQFSR